MAERAIQVVELIERDVAARLADRDRAGQPGELRQLLGAQAEVGDQLVVIGLDRILRRTELRRTDGQRQQSDKSDQSDACDHVRGLSSYPCAVDGKFYCVPASPIAVISIPEFGDLGLDVAVGLGERRRIERDQPHVWTCASASPARP